VFGAVLVASLGSGHATVLNTYDQGAKFDKCISLADWENATIEDDIQLQDRLGSGCCPAGSIPGSKHYNNNRHAQVVCGFKQDGTIEYGGTPCEYNQCYIFKQNLWCASGEKQRLNGCCAALKSCGNNACGFQPGCENSVVSQTEYGVTMKVCRAYNVTYAIGGTTDKTDDQLNGSLDLNKLRLITMCPMGTAPTPAPVPTPGTRETSHGSPWESPVMALSLCALLIIFVNA